MSRMKILVVGSGGREHALVWKLANDSHRPEVFCAPGNAGTAELGVNLDISASDLSSLLAWAKANKPALTVVGPEAPLCEGLTDRFQAAGFKVFGPSQAAARLEGSKVFAKEIMVAAGVPTARFRPFSDASAAKTYIRENGAPIVIKADGLAAGKGVTVAATVEQAEAAVDESLARRAFGDAGATVVVEEYLSGEEVSILALIDGRHIVMLASSQDHKRVFDGDRGPNTGGMGAYSPAPVVKEHLWPVIREHVFERTLRELNRRGIDYHGVLYAGLMMTAEGPKVLEFNCRFGDPETQAILPRWDGDIFPALEACADGRLEERMVRWKSEPCVCVVMAAGGYPGTYKKGDDIEGLAEATALQDVVVFHAGTKRAGDKIVTSGGRVLGVTALGRDLREAVKHVYEAVSKIKFANTHYRKDIAARTLR
jgi:phosphoribosylamine---glycine ligase